MKYLLSIYGNEEAWQSLGEDQMQTLIDETDALHAKLRGTGEFVGAYGVGDEVMAKMVRVADGVPAVTDGPFAETKEQMGGFDIVECADLDEAIEVASKHPVAKVGMIEVRPYWTE